MGAFNAEEYKRLRKMIMTEYLSRLKALDRVFEMTPKKKSKRKNRSH